MRDPSCNKVYFERICLFVRVYRIHSWFVSSPFSVIVLVTCKRRYSGGGVLLLDVPDKYTDSIGSSAQSNSFLE